MLVEKELLVDTFSRFNNDVCRTSSELRVSVQTIMASLKKYKITYEGPKHIYGDLKRTDLSDFQKQLLIGSVLGDGHLEKRSNVKNAMFREEHAVNQVEWLKWKHSNLKPFTTANMWIRDRGDVYSMPDGKGGDKNYNTQNVCAISTISHPYLTYLHNEFYVNRVKRVPMKLIEDEFDWISFAVFWGDDGCFTEDCVRFCTDSFTKDEVEFLANIFSKFYNGRITIRKHKNKSGYKYRIVLTDIKNDHECFDKVKSIIPDSVHYKVPSVLNEHQAATH